jgi:hypothetical protein
MYRGQAADWAPDEPELGIKMQTAQHTNPSDVRKVVIPRPEPAAPRATVNG